MNIISICLPGGRGGWWGGGLRAGSSHGRDPSRSGFVKELIFSLSIFFCVKRPLKIKR